MSKVFQSPAYANIQHEVADDGRWRPIVDGVEKDWRHDNTPPSSQHETYTACRWIPVQEA